MSFFTCRMPSWGVLKKVPHDARNTYEQINQMLGLQFDLALAVKDGVRRELVQGTENDIRDTLHEIIVKMQGVNVQRTRPSNCDICGLIDLVKRMARSQCAKECKNFMLATLDTPLERAGFDWIAAFDDYSREAKLPAGYGMGKRVERSKELMAVLNIAVQDEPLASIVSESFEDDDTPTLDQMIARTKQALAVLSEKHLKIMR